MRKIEEIKASDDHKALVQDLLDVLARHAETSSPEVLLALTAQVVGNILLLQDGERLNAYDALCLINVNIAKGNRAAFNRIQQRKLN